MQNANLVCWQGAQPVKNTSDHMQKLVNFISSQVSAHVREYKELCARLNTDLQKPGRKGKYMRISP